jgi:type II secretory pathway component PulM
MKCRLDYDVEGTRGHAVVIAPTSIAALLLWLETLPEAVAVKVVVRVLQ